MGFRYQDLKDRGDSIELERKESYTNERSHNGYIKRKKTVVRERFPHPHAKEGNKHKQHTKRSVVQITNRPAAESAHTTTETYVYSAGSGALLTTCRDKSHLERAVNRTSVQLKRLAHEIDNEISKLKRERDKLMFRPRPHPLMRNAAIQNDLNVNIEPLNNSQDFDRIANNIEFTIEKFSSQHKFVSTSPRYACDEQTSCRPRMRTIGLQKNTQRSTAGDKYIEKLKAKLDTALQHSATNLANLKSKGLLDTVPPNCYAFDYGGTGDGQNALNIYHLQKSRCAGGCNQNKCNCQKICEHYNSVGNYNGMLCNKNTYVEKGLTPCNEYKYCRDEYHYNCPPQRNNCIVPAANQSCMPYTTYVPTCSPYQPCLAPCPTYSECQTEKPKIKVLYGRRASDLNTEDFYQPTGSSPKKHSSTKQGSARHSSNKERLTVDVPKDGRTSVEIERNGDRAHSKTRRKKDGEKTKQRSSTRSHGDAVDKAYEKRQLRERKTREASESSGSVDSSEKRLQMKSKEKLLEITFTKERRRRPSSESADECISYVAQKPEREYSRETKRSMKQMTITAYKPCKLEDGEGKSDVDRKKKKKRKNHEHDGKSDDDKTWDERLRQAEYPREQADWPTGVPTITEVYDDYRVGDAWEGEEDVGTKQATGAQYLGAYRELYHVPPQSSYDIMPVQKNTVRDIPPASTRSPERGQRTRSPVWQGDKARGSFEREHTEYDIGSDRRLRTGPRQNGKPSRPYERPDSDIVPEVQARTRRDITHASEPASFRVHALEERPRLDGRYGPTGKQTSDGRFARDYSPRQYEQRDPATQSRESYERTQTGVYSSHEKPGSEEKYDSHGSPYKVDGSGVVSRTGKPFSPDRTPRSAHRYAPDENYERREKYKTFSPSQKAAESNGAPTTYKAYSTERTAESAQDYAQDVKPRLGEKYGAYSPSYGATKPSAASTPSRTYSSDEAARSARNYVSDVKPGSPEKYGVSRPSPEDVEPSAVSAPRRTFSPDETPRSAREFPSEEKRRSGERYTPSAADPSFKSKPDRLLVTGETSHNARDNIPDIRSTSDERYDPHSSPRKLYEPSSGVIAGRPLTPKDTYRAKREYTKDEIYDLQRTDESQALQETDRTSSTQIPSPSAREQQEIQEHRIHDARVHTPHQTSDGEKFSKDEVESSDEKIRRNRKDKTKADLKDVNEVKGAIIPYEQAGVSGADTTHKKDAEKTERKYADGISNRREDKHESPDSKKYDYTPATYGKEAVLISKTMTPDTSRTVDSLPTVTTRAGESPVSHREHTGSDKKFVDVPEVPEIRIEDTDESGRSARSGVTPMISLPERAKFAIKGEMVLEPEQIGLPKYKISSEYERKTKGVGKMRETDSHTRSGDQTREAGIRTVKPDNFSAPEGDRSYVEAEKADRFGRNNIPDSAGGTPGPLSPFPSLETPKIYMRPRQPCTDFGTACLPPNENDCPTSSPRQNCVKNAGDVYMCQSQCNSAPPTSCKCLCPRPSGSEVPYEKLGDQYTHSPVRQLAANSHLAVALQPEAATGNFIPSPQQSLFKSCTCFRSTGTQYSATTLERQEDNCVTKFVPLPKDCHEIPINEAERSPPPSTCQCDSPNFRSPSPTARGVKSNYEFLCEEDNEEYEGKVNLNQDQWCGRVEITNMEKTQIFIAQKQGEQMQKSCLKGKDDKSLFLPWQPEQKFIPGQPLGSCNMSPWQDLSNDAPQTEQKLPRFQNYMERRTPRFNATMPPHQEMPEEEARCEEELLHYKPQPRVKFMEQQEQQQYRDCAPSCYPPEAESDFPRGRSSFACSRDYQEVPEFTGCPCMFKTYLNMVTLYYPECRIQLTEDCNEFDDDYDEFNE